MVGVAIITKGRPEVIKKCLEQHKFNTHADRVVLVIDGNDEGPAMEVPFDDGIHLKYYSDKWLGVAGARNKGIEILEQMGCDTFIIMDDDVFPINPAWVRLYQRMLLFYPMLICSPTIWPGLENQFIDYHLQSDGINGFLQAAVLRYPTGVLHAFTKCVLKEIGGFDASMGKYGYEDLDYMERIRKLYGNMYVHYIAPPHVERFLHICDIFGDLGGWKWPGRSALHDIKDSLLQVSRNNYLKTHGNAPIFKPYK